jgi:hypothetical protein
MLKEMTYGPAQKRATYRYRDKVRDTEAYREKVRLSNLKVYARLLENPAKLTAKAVAAKLKRYYSGEPVCDIRRLFI